MKKRSIIITLLTATAINVQAKSPVAPNSAIQYDIRDQASFFITDENNTPIIDVLEGELNPTQSKQTKEYGSLDYDTKKSDLSSVE